MTSASAKFDTNPIIDTCSKLTWNDASGFVSQNGIMWALHISQSLPLLRAVCIVYCTCHRRNSCGTLPNMCTEFTVAIYLTPTAVGCGYALVVFFEYECSIRASRILTKGINSVGVCEFVTGKFGIRHGGCGALMFNAISFPHHQVSLPFSERNYMTSWEIRCTLRSSRMSASQFV